MSEWRWREGTPEPEDVPRWRVAGCSSTGAAWWDIKGQLETIKQLKVNFHRLTSDDAQEHFPEFPKLHDRTWLTLITKLQEAMTVAEHFLTDVDSNDWLRVQASLSGQLYAPGARTRLWDIKRPCERAIKVLEGVAALQAQILAGQHRKPDGKKRLEKPAPIPFSYRRGFGEDLLPEALYPERGEGWVDPEYAVLGNYPYDDIPTDPDYDILRNAEELSQSASDIERYRFVFRTDLVELEEMKSRREQSNRYPSLVPAEHVPLREIAENKGPHELSGLPLKSMKSFIAELDTCKHSGHPPVRQPSPESNGIFDLDLPKSEPSLGSNDSLSLDTSSNPITPRPVVGGTRSRRLPSVYKTFHDDHFMWTSFAVQVQEWKKLPHLPVKRKFDTTATEHGHKAVEPLMKKAMKACDYRIATRHDEDTGDIQVCEYFHDQSRFYLAEDHWNDDMQVDAPESGTNAYLSYPDGLERCFDDEYSETIPDSEDQDSVFIKLEPEEEY